MKGISRDMSKMGSYLRSKGKATGGIYGRVGMSIVGYGREANRRVRASMYGSMGSGTRGNF
jgi:hypothetical protein